MFQRRYSRNDRFEYVIQVERTRDGIGRGKHAAKIVQVIERSTGIALTQYRPVREHYGEWPEDAVDKAFREAETALSEGFGVGRAASRGRFERPPEPTVSTLLDPDRVPEWRSLLARPPNVLFEGTETSTHAFLSTLKPYLREPVQWRRQGAPLELRIDQDGALILQDVTGLDRVQQHKLNRWLEDGSRHRQIVSTASTPLFSLVQQGLFDARLYYRLNVILLQV